MGGGGSPTVPKPVPLPDPATPAASPETRKRRKAIETQAIRSAGRQGYIKTGPLGLMGSAFTNQKTLLGQ